MTSHGILIVGGGQAGSDLAFELRKLGFGGPVTLVSAERHLPYQRPPLSKAVLTGDMAASALTLRAAAAYEKASITVRLGTTVSSVDRVAKRVHLEGGEMLNYDRLALTTGGIARHLRVPNSDLRNIFYLRTIDDVEGLRGQVAPGKRLVIVGGGYVGLEVASALRKQQVEVTVLESADRVLARVAAPEISAFYEEVHRQEGVKIRTGGTVTGFIGKDGAVCGVLCGDGDSLPADFVLVGIGLVPNTELAEQSGLPVDDGIVVDEHCRTADHDIFAAGDCVRFYSHHLRRWARLESVPNALEQAKTAAAAMCGIERAYTAAPWFWSDQFSLKLQMVGIADDYDETVLRGSFDARSLIQFYRKDGHLIGADSVNRPGEFMIARRLIEARSNAPAAALRDEGRPLRSLLA